MVSDATERVPPESRRLAEAVLKKGPWPKFYFTKNGKGGIRRKTYLDNVGGVPPTNLWEYKDVGHTDEAKKELKAIFGGDVPFDTPKPTRLIERILQIASDEDSIVLDSFAGSGTTAHAVLNANAKDGGTRRFVLIEMCDYADSVTAERVKRVGGAFSFYELGPELMIGGVLNEAVPTEAIREYVWYNETRGAGGTASVPSAADTDATERVPPVVGVVSDATERVSPGLEDLTSIPEGTKISTGSDSGGTSPDVADMAKSAEVQGDRYDEEVNNRPEANPLAALGVEMAGVYRVDEQFADEVAELRLPQFVLVEDAGLFGNRLEKILLTPESLLDGFTLDGKDATIPFSTSVADEVKVIDLAEKGEAVLKSKQMSPQEMAYLTSQLSGCEDLGRGAAAASGTLRVPPLHERPFFLV